MCLIDLCLFLFLWSRITFEVCAHSYFDCIYTSVPYLATMRKALALGRERLIEHGLEGRSSSAPMLCVSLCPRLCLFKQSTQKKQNIKE